MTKERLDISEALIEQISEDPKLYWSYEIEYDGITWSADTDVEEVFTSEDAAINDRNKELREGGVIAIGDIYAETKEQALSDCGTGVRRIEVKDESGRTIETWEVA